MKFYASLFTLLLVVTGSIRADEFIRQKQLNSGLVWDQHVQSAEGTNWASVPVSTGGSVFSLYALGNGNDTKLYKLDATTAGSSFPTIALSIVSEDPHFPPRTRADKAFFVALKPQGGSHPTAISLHHRGIGYNPSTHAADTQSQKTNFGWTQMDGKKKQYARFFTQLPSTDPTQAEGEETVTIYSQHPSNKQWLPLNTAGIQVWPVAQASISGITPGSTITDATAKNLVSLKCQDLYPDSITYAQIYHSKEKLGTLGKVLPQSVVKFDTQVPQDQKIPLGNVLQTLEDGHYTIEVLTITPFNSRKPERLTHVSFVIDRGAHNPGFVSTGDLDQKQ